MVQMGKNNGINYIIDNFLKTNQLNYKGKKLLRENILREDACLVVIKALSSKYDNEYLNITGKNKVKIIKVMKLIAKIFNYKKLSFKNLEIEGHYVNEPKIFHSKKR